MPTPNEGESREDFVKRCIPMVMGDGAAEDNDQAVAMCNSMFEQARKSTGGPINPINFIVHEHNPSKETLIPNEPEKALDPDSLIYFGEAVKALGDGKVGGYLLRFTTENDPDLKGDFFTKDTDFGEYETAPVYFEHGLDPALGTRKIGKAIHTKDEFGIWAEAHLGLRDRYEKFVYSLAEKGKLGWSSGTMPNLIVSEPAGKATWIKSWQLGLDDTLTTHPAEYRNSVIPLKSLFPQPPEGEAETVGETVPSESGSVEENQVIDVSDKGVTEMDITEEKLSELIDAAADKALKAYQAALPTNGDGGLAAPRVEVIHDPADDPFLTLADNCKAVKTFEMSKGQDVAPRLRYLKATGAAEGVPSDGGILLEPTLTGELLMPLHQEGPFTRDVRRLPVGSNSNYGWINGVDETSRADGSRWGGIRGYRLAEGGTITASKPKFRRINWELKKYAVLAYGTDELLVDAAQFSAVVRTGAAEEISFMANDDVLNGIGTGGPVGILNSGALISITAETGQVAATIVQENLLKMWARLDARSKPKARWYINTDCYPQLHVLSIAAGTAALEPRFVNYGADGSLTIFGKPVVETEFNATLGTVGDILLADMSQYLYWEKGGLQAASSIHVQFLTDETVFRFIYRCDGQSAIASALTPYKGTSNTVSPFVVIATRS